MKIKEFIEELKKFDLDSDVSFVLFDVYENKVENIEIKCFDKSTISKTIIQFQKPFILN